MTPDPAQKTPAPSAQSSEIVLLWRRYLACRDDRSHDQLLRAVDRLIRHEAKRMLVSHPYLAEEAAQEALLGVERKIGSLEAPEYPTAFIRKVLSNKISTLLQRESRRRAREERNWSPDVPDENITTSTEWHEFLGTLRTAVNDDEFWTLVLRYHFDFSYDEIGELLEKEAGTIRQIALRGRQKCRQRLSRLEGRVPAWFGMPIEAEQPWRLRDPGEQSAPSTANPATPEPPPGTTTQMEAQDPPPEIAARKAGEWGQDISDSADGLRRASIGSDSSAPREPKTTSRRFGQLTVHVGTATSRLGGVGRRWLYAAPSSVLPLVVLVAVPALAFSPDVDASAVIQSTSSSEPTGPTATDPQNSGSVPAGGGSAGADRAGRQDVVERPIDHAPTGPAQFPVEQEPNDEPADGADRPADPATTTPGTSLFFDQAVVPSGPALPVPFAPTTDGTTQPPTTGTPGAAGQPTTAPTDTVPVATSTTPAPTVLAPTVPVSTTAAPPTTTAPTTAQTATTTRQTTTTRRSTSTDAATAPTAAATTTIATTTAPTTTTTVATTAPTTTTTAATTTTTAPTTTIPTTTTVATTTSSTTTASTTTTVPPTTVPSTTTAPSTTTTAQTTTTQDTATTLPPPIGPT